MTYDLLSDVDSAVIREFGILNTLISPDDPEQAAGRGFYGVPFPGVYVTDESGVVSEKFFPPALRQPRLGGDHPRLRHRRNPRAA